MMEDLNEEINFEGQIIKRNHSGYFKCPYRCGDPSYPQRKWKTLKGFEKHMTECAMRPSAIKTRIKKGEEELEKFETMKKELLDNLTYKIGDKIFFVHKYILKDTHEWRGDRKVKVRYEPIIKYEARETTLNDIDIRFFNICPINIEYMKSNNLFLNNAIKLSQIRKTKEEAEKDAKEANKADEEYRKFSEFVR